MWYLGSSRGGRNRNYLSFTGAIESTHVVDNPHKKRRGFTQRHQSPHPYRPPAPRSQQIAHSQFLFASTDAFLSNRSHKNVQEYATPPNAYHFSFSLENYRLLRLHVLVPECIFSL